MGASTLLGTTIRVNPYPLTTHKYLKLLDRITRGVAFEVCAGRLTHRDGGQIAMRYRSVCGIALFLVLVGIAGPASAQGGGNDVNEEVRRAVERAVGASVSTSVSESL